MAIHKKKGVNMPGHISTISAKYPKITMLLSSIICLLALLQFPKIEVDTDPENMLSEREFVRVFHHDVKRTFSLYDFIVLGIVNEEDPDGVFNPRTLAKVYEVTNGIEKIEGVIPHEIIAPSKKDNITQAGLGAVRFEYLMKSPPKTRKEALLIRDEAKDNPLFNGTLVSEDGKALCIYVPIEKKDLSYQVSRDIFRLIRDLRGEERYHITGLPVAEDTFGVEMFRQMAVSAPLAGLIIFLLMWFFFKKLNLIISPMIVAMVTVITTMGLLIGCGFTVHIMSSMIPIFLMPISVVDSVHILSEFHDRFPKLKDKNKTISEVMANLFMPMLYTSLTSAAGFASLALTPIPPVQVFGLFVAFGIMFAWFLTITFIPAYITLSKITVRDNETAGREGPPGILSRIVKRMGEVSAKNAKGTLVIVALVCAVSAYGISRISINDNPIKWFTKNHRIRIADRVLNEHFGGTYTAYLVLDTKKRDGTKDPRFLKYVEDLQNHLLKKGLIGKSTSLSDVVKKVYYELMDGDKANYNRVPDTQAAVAQCLISFQNSHKPDDLWHFTTPDYSKLNIWLQLKSGDNKDMDRVLDAVSAFLEKNEPPIPINHDWAGLTYINTVWQNRMVAGMLKSLMGSFVIVLLMMIFLFRSPLWGIIAVIPLSITILFIYGMIGIFGKDYDMPVAVLSSLTLGISVDFAIHFLQRTRVVFERCGNWEDSLKELFEEPARAITRNAIVIAIGFMPLLLAPLMPYKTVGFFLSAIMVTSSLATFFILPAAISLTKKAFFKKMQSPGCNCVNCLIISSMTAACITYITHSLLPSEMKSITVVSFGAVLMSLLICNRISSREACKKAEGGK
jgi:predicted RND superfamily exporter protein